MDAPSPWKRPATWPFPIETERLTLRLPTHDDAQQVFDAVEANRPSLHPWMPWPQTENRSVGQTHYTIETFLRQLAADSVTNMPIFICDRQSGQYIGGTGLHTFVPATQQAECGYWVVQDRRGSGVCTEAVIALTELALRRQPAGGLGLRRLEICCSADNTPSAAVARNAGYLLEATLRKHRWLDGVGWSDTLVYAALAETWTKP